jgi:hypothetical protein
VRIVRIAARMRNRHLVQRLFGNWYYCSIYRVDFKLSSVIKCLASAALVQEIPIIGNKAKHPF